MGRTDPGLMISLIGVIVLRMYANIVQTFQQLWINSFREPKGPMTKEESVTLYSNISMSCDLVNIFGCVFIFAIGKQANKIPSKLILPLIFLLNGLCFMLFPFIDNPNSFFCYSIWMLLTLIFLIESVSLETYFSRIVPKDIRGLMYAAFFFTGLIGRLINYKTSEILFEYGKNQPFLMIGYCHFGFSLFVTIMILIGKFEKKSTRKVDSL